MAVDLPGTAFREGQTIPGQSPADGKDVSPPLKWSNPPATTKSFALICEDPDAPRGTWTHWVLFNLPPSCRELPEGVPALDTLPDGSHQGTNDFGKVGYGGPAPPPGKPHRYFFKIYPPDSKPNLKAGANKTDVERAMKGPILGQAELVGRHRRLPDGCGHSRKKNGPAVHRGRSV